MDRTLFLLFAFLAYSVWRLVVWNWPLSVQIVADLSMSKYHASSRDFVTTTPTYTLQATDPVRKNNSDSLSNVTLPQEFDYSDPEKVIGGTSQLACLPRLFGYSEAEGLSAFPWVGYPRCSQLHSESQYISIDRERNLLTMNCSSGKYVLGPVDSRKLVLRSEMEKLWTVAQYSGSPVAIDPQYEFAFGTCDNSFEMKQAVYVPRFNETLLQHTKVRIEALRKQYGKATQPLSVLVMVIDSFSRKHFFRKLPQTVRFLNDLKRDCKFSVSDFYIHNIVGTNSVGNQAPLLGKNISERYIGDLNDDFAGKDALWNIFHEMGFVTLLGLESCDSSFSRKLGRMPRVDYVSSSFFFAAHKLTNYKTAMENRMQRCIGLHMSHVYLFNYTLSVAKMYEEVNKWLYVHVSAAHEATGQHAETLDADLRDFLQDFLRTHPNTVVFLEGDHGMRYRDWMKSEPAFQENRLPPLFLITPAAVIDAIPGARDTVAHNALRLNSKYDMRKTMIFLSGLPYGLNASSEELFPAVSMYTERVSDSRTCQDAGIPLWHCSCLTLQPLDPVLLTRSSPLPELTALLNILADIALTYFNSLVYTPVSSGRGALCSKLSLNSIDSAFGLQLDSMQEKLQLEFRTNESVSARFEVQFLLSSGKAYTSEMEGGYPPVAVLYNGFRKQARMLSFSRLDKHDGPCEQKARTLNLQAEVCICKIT